jgi:hypothetical protein
MKRFFNKKSMIITSVALLLSVAVGITLAYVFTNTEPVENTFKPSKVACAVVENGVEDENTDDIVVTGTTKTDVKIKNTGDTDAYIRVAVVVNWMSADGRKVWATSPTANDYEITKADGSVWTPSPDGYFYYKDSVAPGNMTDVIIKEVKLREGVTGPVGTDGTQYYLSVEIVASAIQADGMGANSAQEAWANAQQNG